MDNIIIFALLMAVWTTIGIIANYRLIKKLETIEERVLKMKSNN